MPTIKVELPDAAIDAFCDAYGFDNLEMKGATAEDRICFAEDQVVSFVQAVLEAYLVKTAVAEAEVKAREEAVQAVEQVVVLDSPQERPVAEEATASEGKL
jgi:hypothetical protein